MIYVVIGIFMWGMITGWVLTLSVQVFVDWRAGKHRAR